MRLRLFFFVDETSCLIRVLNRWSWITLGQMHGFSRFGHRGHWQVAHKPSFMCHLSVSPEPELEKLCNFPKVIQLHLLRTLWLPVFEVGLWLIILIKFELKSNSIGLASTKNANLQIAQAMKQKCIFCCFKFDQS